MRNSLAYNVLVGDEEPWNELTYSVSAVYRFHRFMEANGGLYMASAKQSKNLRSIEYRPFVSFRIFTNPEKRWTVTNLSRLEMRNFVYSDRNREHAFRFRNRTYAAISLIRQTLIEDNNLTLFGYFEAFFNFGQEVRERFFNQYKYKLGFGYRLSYPWRFNIGVIYQNSKNTTGGPAHPAGNIITKYVIEWGVAYIIPAKKRD